MTWCADDRSVETSPFSAQPASAVAKAATVDTSLLPFFRTLRKKFNMVATAVAEDAESSSVNEDFDYGNYCAEAESDCVNEESNSYEGEDLIEGTEETSESSEGHDWFNRSKFGDS